MAYSEILAPGVFCANLMQLILRIMKLRFVRVAAQEGVFEVLLYRLQRLISVAWNWFYRIQEVDYCKNNLMR
jgi:hypothetical protein